MTEAASYVDCVARPLPTDCKDDALGLYLATTRPPPRWLNTMLAMRDLLVRPLGLKTVGCFGSTHEAQEKPRSGDRLDIFTIMTSSADELTLFIEDRHLDVFLSFLTQEEEAGRTLFVTTVVKTHNLLGRAYMLGVAPIHRILVKHLLMRAARRRLACSTECASVSNGGRLR